MPVLKAGEGVPFAAHGSTFRSFAGPSRGGHELCAWRLEVPADQRGVPHRPSKEEVLLVLDGNLEITLDGILGHLRPGDVAVVPAGTEMTVSGGRSGAAVWVTTTAGLTATLPDGTRFQPPWAQ